jgi:hypothetical protein
MRLGRIILASLTALAASYSYAQTLPSPVAASESLPRILQAVVPLFVTASEASSAAPVEFPPPQAVLKLGALAGTGLGGSLFLVSSLSAVNLATRRHQRALLRC